MPPAWRQVLRHPLPWILLFAALIRWQSAGYMRSSDDLDYAQAARSLLNGTYNPGPNIHHHRLAIVFPTALSFALFGYQYWASILWPMAASLLSIGLLYRIVSDLSGRETAAVAALFLAASTQHALSGAELFPDSALAFWSLLSVWWYVQACRGEGGRFRYALSGLCFYLAYASRIEALAELPIFLFLELLFRRRRGFDPRCLGFLGGFLLPLAGEILFQGLMTGHPWARFAALFPAVEEWKGMPASRTTGLWSMLKSLGSPFGAFGLFFVIAAVGAAWRIRQGRMRVVAAIAAYILVMNLAVAWKYRLGDGRYYTLISPLVAWFAAELVAAIPRQRWRFAGVGALVLAGTILLHVRLPLDSIRAYGQLNDLLAGSPDRVYSDARTVNAMEFYFPGPRMVCYGSQAPVATCWLVDNARTRWIDRELYGIDPFPDDPGTMVRSIPLTHRGLPGFIPLVRVLFGWKGAGGSGELRVYRIER